MQPQIPISSFILDEENYPTQPNPDKPGKYRLLDGVHRWNAFKPVGVVAEIDAIIIENLHGTDPLLYAAKKAIGPRQLTEDEVRDTARRAFWNNPGLASSEIGRAIGRSRRTVDSYVADLRAVVEMDPNLKLFRMNRLGIPQDRIAKRLGAAQASIQYHLSKMPALANSPNTDLSKGFTVAQLAEKHACPACPVKFSRTI